MKRRSRPTLRNSSGMKVGRVHLIDEAQVHDDVVRVAVVAQLPERGDRGDRDDQRGDDRRDRRRPTGVEGGHLRKHVHHAAATSTSCNGSRIRNAVGVPMSENIPGM